ncbi:MAG TPA: ABC transporter substrate-binding protein [Tepidisphaeraceae bacterium]|jgi:branched-chain amino acid transport system substrate-binding protein|nr:ABC transporter substrate-binding protein [Tepidisphaeraceae bacterium]
MQNKIAAVILAASVFLSVSCDKGGSSGSGAGSSASSTGDIVVGEYGSMTGSEATFGISTDNGVKMAVKERNAAGGVKGRKIKLISYDDQGKQQEVVTAVTRLIQQDKVVAVIGEVASSLSIAGGQVAQRNGVPMISPSSTNPQVTEIGDMISRVCFIDPFQGYVGAKFAYDRGMKSAGVLYDRSQAYSTGLKNDFIKAFTQLGGKVTTEQAYSKGDNDFSAQLTAIRGGNPDFIYVPGYYTDVVNIARQARKLGIKAPLIGGDGWVSEELKNAGDALDGCFFSDHYAHEDPRPEVQEFLKKYKADYGRTPDSMAALGYDAANLLFDAMERASSLSGKDLAAAIASTKDFKGVTGTISIDEKRNAKKLAVIQKVQGGAFAYFDKVEPPK